MFKKQKLPPKSAIEYFLSFKRVNTLFVVGRIQDSYTAEHCYIIKILHFPFCGNISINANTVENSYPLVAFLLDANHKSQRI